MTRRKLGRLVKNAVLLIGAVVMLYPIALIVMSSFKTMADFLVNSTGLPTSLTLSNYVTAWRDANFGGYFMNTVLVTSASVLGIVLASSMAGYAISRKFRGSRLIFGYLLLGMMIPAQATIISLFGLVNELGLLNTYVALILVYIAYMVSIGILLFRGYFITLPPELREAGLLDGCSEMGVFWRIMLPSAKPVIATIIIFGFMFVWNDFFMPLVLMTDPDKYTVSVGLLALQGQYSNNWPALFAAMTIILLPVLVLFVFLQRYFVAGLTGGAVKG